jgi:uncharacterized Ntn-hydrolase superfamily protein
MKYAGILFFLLSYPLCALATWSIIIADPISKKIGIAGASCTYNCYGIGKIVPGKGAIVVQAMSNKWAREKGVAMLLTDASPQEIIDALTDSLYEPEQQQYGVVSLLYITEPRTYTGSATQPFQGTLLSPGVAIQGNTLANEQVVHAILKAIEQGKQDQLPLEEILMLALEAGSAAGGDKRCGEQRATSAFLIVANPTDKLKKASLDLQFFGQKKGGMNAVTLLRGKYERWKSKHGGL